MTNQLTTQIVYKNGKKIGQNGRGMINNSHWIIEFPNTQGTQEVWSNSQFTLRTYNSDYTLWVNETRNAWNGGYHHNTKNRETLLSTQRENASLWKFIVHEKYNNSDT